MDSVTQAVLGASVGEAVLGRRVGGKAAAWGAVLGTLPDLDVLADPWLTDVEALVFHRSLTHAFAFACVVAPMIGWGLARRYRKEAATWRGWTGLAFAVLFTHPLLDCFTTYGTQVFQPFSRYPVAFNSIFIIDPLYTVPLALGLLLALRRPRTAAGRRRANAVGLVLSTLYLLMALGAQSYARHVVTQSLADQGLTYDHLAMRPTPLNALLWTGQARDSTGYWVGLYSLLDADRTIRFQHIPRNDHLLDGLRDDPEVQTLRWFSRGYYRLEATDDGLFFYDLRFGRTDAWLSDEGTYIFSFRLTRADDDSTRIAHVEQMPVAFEATRMRWGTLLARIGGVAPR